MGVGMNAGISGHASASVAGLSFDSCSPQGGTSEKCLACRALYRRRKTSNVSVPVTGN